MKTCSKCKIDKSLDQFYKIKNRNNKPRPECLSCAKEYQHTRKDYYYKRNYGVSLEQFNEMLILQDNKCKICNRDQSELKSTLHVDHCHQTGKVRGLLCASCNRGIGFFSDNPDLLIKAISYLRNEDSSS